MSSNSNDIADAFVAGYAAEYDAHVQFVISQMRTAYPHLTDAEVDSLLGICTDMRDAGFSSDAIAAALEGEIRRR
jgi:hypothetical protein